MLAFTKTNWFPMACVIFSSVAFVLTTQHMSESVGKLVADAPLVDDRIAALEANSKQQTSVLSELRDDMRSVRVESEKQGRQIAAICASTDARCSGM